MVIIDIIKYNKRKPKNMKIYAMISAELSSVSLPIIAATVNVIIIVIGYNIYKMVYVFTVHWDNLRGVLLKI